MRLSSAFPFFMILTLLCAIGQWAGATEYREEFKRGQGDWVNRNRETSGSCELGNSAWINVVRASDCCLQTEDPERINESCQNILFGGQSEPRAVSTTDIPEAGLNGSSRLHETALSDAASKFDRFAGVCTEVAKTCESFVQQANYPACATQAPKCVDTKKKSAYVLGKADGLVTAGGQIDPGLSGAKDNPSGETPTQKPSSAGGGGGGGQNPLGGLMSALQQAMQPKPKEPVDTTAQSCESNPALAGCPAKTAASDSWNKASADSGFQTASGSDSANQFDVGASDGLKASSYTGEGDRQVSPPSAGGSGVPNGGGSMPGGAGGGGVGGGSVDNNAGGPGPQKKLTDIMQGMMAGGYSQMNQGMQMQNGSGSSGFGGYGGGGRGDYKPGMDLRQFLPGGKNDPTRKLAGRITNGPDIQPQTVNIWNRISERIRARCTQGLLRDCGP